MPAVHVQCLGARRVDLQVEDRMEVADFRALVARTIGSPVDRLKIMKLGRALRDQEGVIDMDEGTAFLAVMTKPGEPSTLLPAPEKAPAKEEGLTDVPTF